MKSLPPDPITTIDEAKSLAQRLLAWQVWNGHSPITVTMLPAGPFVWSDLFGKRDTTEREAEVSCKVGHARWTDWDLRHDAKCMTCPGETVAKYTGKMREKK